MLSVRTIDSHTGGEPTRVVLDGGLPLDGATMAARLEDFRRRFDPMRSGIVNEPRGSEVLVGAVLTPPVSVGAVAGIVFFNNVGYLGMCGHGTIGVVETLRHLGRIGVGEVKLDTPVGPVVAHLLDSGDVSIQNVRSYRHLNDVVVAVEGLGEVIGDVAYGGNWFYIVHSPNFAIDLSVAHELTHVSRRIREALVRDGITGADGAEIDHIELGGEGQLGGHSRNFVLCPGGAYDRSPCGTGTSAKLACLSARGELRPGDLYVQESITGSSFRGSIEMVDGGVIPTIVGRAFITAESTLLFADEDPIRWGLGS